MSENDMNENNRMENDNKTALTEEQKALWVEEEYGQLKRGHKVNLVLWWILVVMTALVFFSGVASVVMFLIDDSLASLETTLNQLLMSVLALLCFFAFVIFRKRFKLHIPSYLLVVIYLFIFAHFILGEVYRVYDSSILFDKILHTTGGVVIACIGISVAYALSDSGSSRVRLSPFFVVLFAFCFALAIEYVWELFEYGVDRIINANMQRWKDSIIGYDEAGNAITSVPWGSGLNDSMQDMIVNIIGAFSVCLIFYFVLSKKPEWMRSNLIVSDRTLHEIAVLNVEEKIARGEPMPAFAQKQGQDPAGEAEEKDAPPPPTENPPENG